jgi:hypothetical protein
MTIRSLMRLPWVALLLVCTATGQQTAPTLQERLGYPPDARLLIIHADDFGMSHSENRATIEALEKGWITSASIMVPAPWFPEAARWAREHPSADIGIHLVLNSEWDGLRWGPIAGREKVPSLLDKGGFFFSDTVLMKSVNLPEVKQEISAQLAMARAAGVHVTHLDSHMTALMTSPGMFQAYRELGATEHLPVLFERQGGDYSPLSAWGPLQDAPIDKALGLQHGIPLKDWTAWYEHELAALKPGVYELVLHLAYDDDEMRGVVSHNEDFGPAWRQADFDMVRSPEFQQFLRAQKFVLIRWSDLARVLKP